MANLSAAKLQQLISALDGLDIESAAGALALLQQGVQSQRPKSYPQNPCDVQHQWSDMRPVMVLSSTGQLSVTGKMAERSCILCGVKAEHTGEGHGIDADAKGDTVDSTATPGSSAVASRAPMTSAPTPAKGWGAPSDVAIVPVPPPTDPNTLQGPEHAASIIDDLKAQLAAKS